MKEKPAVEVRLDKWLWAARFYKTRALAREMIEGGKVHYNGQRSKPSKIVELNATLTLRPKRNVHAPQSCCANGKESRSANAGSPHTKPPAYADEAHPDHDRKVCQ